VCSYPVTASTLTTFQHAHDVAANSGEIDVLDPAGCGPLIITKGISVQAHGFGGITATSGGTAITVAVTTSDPVMLNGLLLDGGGTGQFGIRITAGPSVQILNNVGRHFSFGIYDQTTTNGSNLLIEDTIVSDNLTTGIGINPGLGGSIKATLSRISVNNNAHGVLTAGSDTTIANSVLSNNQTYGLSTAGGIAWLAKTVISGNGTGVELGGPVNSYGDNYIRDNTTPVANGSLTPVTTQ
jgi:hypothetical protein